MNQGQNNDQAINNAFEEQELSTEELEEVMDEVKEDNYWNECFNQLERMKKCQINNGKKDTEKFNKNHSPLNKLELYKSHYHDSIYYWSDEANFLKMTDQDNTMALINYKRNQKNLREIKTYMETTTKYKRGTPTWDGYCKWHQELIKRNNARKEEKKPKKNN